jgi:hypothetical protein
MGRPPVIPAENVDDVRIWGRSDGESVQFSGAAERGGALLDTCTDLDTR